MEGKLELEDGTTEAEVWGSEFEDEAVEFGGIGRCAGDDAWTDDDWRVREGVGIVMR